MTTTPKLELLTEPCTYGYWVGPDGEVYPVLGWQMHVETADLLWRQLGLDPGWCVHGTVILEEAGWIDITVNLHLAVPSWQMPERLTRRQAQALLRIVGWHQPSAVFIDSTSFPTGAEATRYIRECLGSGAVEEK